MNFVFIYIWTKNFVRGDEFYFYFLDEEFCDGTTSTWIESKMFVRIR